MGDLGNSSELEAELIKRNREIAKVRDEVLKAERRLEDAQMRNDDLLEKVAVLDSEVTTKSKQVTVLEEKVEQLDHKVTEKEAEIKVLLKEHEEKVEAIRSELEAGHASRAQELAAQEELRCQITSLQTEKDRLGEHIEEEKRNHQMTKVTLDQAESSAREASNRVVESRRRLKELEDELKEKEGLSTAQVQQLEEDRSRMSLEIQRITGAMEEHKAVREDLEGQARERDSEMISMKGELEDLRRETLDHKGTISDLEAARDMAIKQHEDHVAGQDEVLQAERKQQQEHLHRVMQEAASLDGRLSGQRLLLQETSQALDRSEETEARLSDELAEKGRQLVAEQEAMKSALELEAEKAARELSVRSTHYASELQSEEVCLRRHASSEIDAANRSAAEAEEKERSSESRLQALLSDHEEAKGHHGRSLEALRSQTTDLRQRLAEAEERGGNHQQEGEKLRKDLEEARLEAERNVMAHRQELERLQQTLEAEGQSRSSAERILQSQMEEKDTLLEHRNATIERVEQDLADARRRIEELEASVAKAREDGEAKVHAMGVRNAQLEGEVRSRHERLTEVEGRLEAQRQYLEQVNETLNQALTDKDSLLHAKGSLEAQLKQELSHKDAVTASLSQSQEDSSRRCKELEERILRDRDSHRDAMDEVKRSVAEELKQSSDRLQAVEAELLTARQRCELLMRNKADLQREVEEHRERQTGHEATVRDHQGEQERLQLDLEQQRSARSALEGEVAQLKKDRLDCDAKIKDLETQAVDFSASGTNAPPARRLLPSDAGEWSLQALERGGLLAACTAGAALRDLGQPTLPVVAEWRCRVLGLSASGAIVDREDDLGGQGLALLDARQRALAGVQLPDLQSSGGGPLWWEAAAARPDGKLLALGASTGELVGLDLRRSDQLLWSLRPPMHGAGPLAAVRGPVLGIQAAENMLWAETFLGQDPSPAVQAVTWRGTPLALFAGMHCLAGPGPGRPPALLACGVGPSLVVAGAAPQPGKTVPSTRVPSGERSSANGVAAAAAPRGRLGGRVARADRSGNQRRR